MVRSMYSGVAGMKANQSRMDVIGNNIANANTYGYKSGRATFRDMYYQQVRGASRGTQTRGGINPSMVGYGSQMSSIDLMMDSSSMTSTGFALDAAITGEGFFQVMDPDGNIYYTKAGMFDIDSATGALVDSNGNFVLGTGATDGKINNSKPGKEKIFISVNPVQASVASVESEISGKTVKITSTNQTKDANVGFAFTKATDMPDGRKVEALVDNTSTVINLRLNANETFSSLDELNTEINNAIVEAYGGTHPGGTFNFAVEPNPFVVYDENGNPTAQTVTLTGAEIIDTAAADYEGGGIEMVAGGTDPAGVLKNGSFANGFKIVETGLKFSGNGDAVFSVEQTATDGPAPWTVTIEVDGVKYTGIINQDRADSSSGANTLLLTRADGGDANDTITVSYPNTSKLPGFTPTNADGSAGAPLTDITNLTLGTATASQPTHKLGWGKSTFTLTGGTEYTVQDVSNLTGISIGADGTLTGTSEAGLQVLGRIDLATFANPKGLQQTGNSYFSESSNSGSAKLTIAGENGTGAVKNSALEMSNVDLAQEFADMIVTQRGFQASSRMITVSDTMLEELVNLKR